MTDIQYLDSILTQGLKGSHKARGLYNDGFRDQYVWFDYIGDYGSRIFYSNTGIATAANRKLVLVLDFKLLYGDYKDKHYFMVTSNFSRYEEVEDIVWDSEMKQIDMKLLMDQGVEALMQLSTGYVAINKYLKFIVVSSKEDHTKAVEITRRHGLDIPVLVFDDNIQVEEHDNVVATCGNLSGETPKSLIALAKRLNLPLDKKKKASCILLYELLKMISLKYMGD